MATPTALWPGYIAPTEAATPPWIFPNALNRTYIAAFNKQLSPTYNSEHLPNGTSVFSWGTNPDIISGAAWNLNDDERVDVSPTAESEPLPFGHEDVVVMIGDFIQPSWSGGDSKFVGMACRYCTPSTDGGVYQDNKKCSTEHITEYQTGGIATGTLSSTFWEMEHQYQYLGQMSINFQGPRKISSGTRIKIPRIGLEPQTGGTSGTAICMLTLDWEASTFNSKHSVPFPLMLVERTNGRTNDDYNRAIYDPWVFNASFPRGVSSDGMRFGCQGDSIEPIGHQVHGWNECSGRGRDVSGDGNRNGTWSGGGNNGTTNGTWIYPSAPEPEQHRDVAWMRKVVSSTVASVGGTIIIALIVWALWRQKKRRQSSHGEVREEEIGGEGALFGNTLVAGDKKPGKEKVETDSVEVVVPPPTYAEATKDEITRA
ncbi:hypothetical protein N0V90_002081 [Kalmusia sp. IMI 367209]|nr:hypothetical protein N0V90_002081 [Kalmusia sp. IMI 367209]